VTHPSSVMVGPIVLAVPSGWQVSSTSFGEACIQPDQPRPAVFGCAGLDVSWGWDEYLPGRYPVGFTRSTPAWYDPREAVPCPVDPGTGANKNRVTDPGTASAAQLRPVGDRKAYFYTWTAKCHSGYTFRPRAWYLPTSKVLILDRIGYPDLDSIVTGATYDTGRWSTGFGRAGGTDGSGPFIEFARVQWLSGEAAIAYYDAHGGHGGPPDDYVLTDLRPKVRMQVLPDARVIGNFQLAGNGLGPRVLVSVNRLLQFLKQNHYTTFEAHQSASGVVDYLEELFRP
jgi:hypothetical protein